MSDNTQVINPAAIPNGDGDIIATDDIGGVKFQRVKVIHGDDGVNDGDASHANPLPILLHGRHDSGAIHHLPVTSEGHLEVAIHEPRLPFGAIHTESIHPVFQVDALYGANPAMIVETEGLGFDPGPAIGANSGSSVAANNKFTCSTGTTAFSFASLQSRSRLRYRPGQGILVRYASLWSTPAADAISVAGVGTAESGFFFGYNGTNFGILHSTGGVREVQTLTITNEATTGGTITLRLNGLDNTVTIPTGADPTATAYDISQQTYSGWSAEQIGSTVVFVAAAVGNKTGTFSLTNGTAVATAGTFAETHAGVASTDTWILQTSWNGDKLDGLGASGVTLDPSMGNVYEIDIQFLGFGSVAFKVEVNAGATTNNHNVVVVHTLQIPNSQTATSVSQPSFPFTMAASSAGSTTDVSVSSSCFAGFIEGPSALVGPRLNYFGTASSSVTVYTPLFTIRNDLVYKGRVNQTIINLLSVSGAAKSNNGLTVFYLIRNATLTGPTSFGAYSATVSSTYFDNTSTACTFDTNDQIIWSATTSETGAFNINFLTEDRILLQPGETLTLAVQSVTATAVCVGQINTREDQ